MTTKPTENETELRITIAINMGLYFREWDGKWLKEINGRDGTFLRVEDMTPELNNVMAIITSDKQRLLQELMEELPNTRTIANPDAHEQGWSKHEAQPFNDCLHRVNSVIQNKLEGLS